MVLSGKQCIAGDWVKGDEGLFYAIEPTTGKKLPTAYSCASVTQVEQVLCAAASAAPILRKLPLADIANFLETCADEIEQLGEPLFLCYCQETGYGLGRAKAETQRTTQQLRLFARYVREGSEHLDVRIDTAEPDRKPSPRPDIRFVNQAIGPVVVFGASNFPLAYSVAGGDSVAALAAGCPLIVKGHPSHPGTCELVAQALCRAICAHGLPAGTFSLIVDEGFERGRQLVLAPQVKAVGFTGSLAGGRALFDLANSRDEPIPVFAEMGSINPVVMLPQRLAECTQEVAKDYVDSLTLGTGQSCVNPGLVLVLKSEALQTFYRQVTQSLAEVEAGVMLNQRICQAYLAGTSALRQHSEVHSLGGGQPVLREDGYYVRAEVFTASAKTFLADVSIREEIFGPCSLIVECESKQVLERVLSNIPGQLTGTLQVSEQEMVDYVSLIDLLSQKVGRIIINGFPTGVEVGPSTVHGGPYPATTDARFTSVGTAAIFRFLRPVARQNFPQSLLPTALKNENPLGLRRCVNGVYTCEPLVSK